MHNLVLLGPAGSGKSTQAERLVERFDLKHIDSGGLLREAAKTQSLLGREIDKLINKRGVLVPDSVLMHVLEESLSRTPYNKGIILDGTPRRLSQIATVESLFRRFDRELDGVIFIRIAIETAIERIRLRYSCTECLAPLILGRDIASPGTVCPHCGSPVAQREDDTPKGIRRRYEVFMHDTLPVIEHYRMSGKLIEVDGTSDPEDIARQIVERL